MPESQEAVQLKEMNQQGLIKNCIIDGPLSYDLCFDPESAKIKGLTSDVAGDPDLIIYPDLVTGNAVSKALVLNARAIGSSVILGTAVPVVLPHVLHRRRKSTKYSSCLSQCKLNILPNPPYYPVYIESISNINGIFLYFLYFQ